MTLRFVAFLCLLVSFKAQAFFDYNAAFFFRNWPLAGGVIGKLGYNYELYKRPHSGEGENIFRGFIRPNLEARITPVHQYLSTNVEIFPLSILGISAGVNGFANISDLPDYNCTAFDCEGTFFNQHVDMKMVLGYKFIFTRHELRYDFLDENSDSKAWIHPSFGMAISPQGNDLFTWKGLLGAKFKNYFGALSYQRTKINGGQGSFYNQAVVAGANWKEKWTTILALGSIRSSILEEKMYVSAFVKYNFKKGLGLF